jgi:hypothetical protein
MSSPTTRSFDASAGRTSPEIADFVAAVRAWLDDLSSDEVTELTGGLEADLTDALAEAGSTPSDLYGDPGEYASELRAAAGLPPRGAGGVQRAAGAGFAERVEQRFVIPVRKMIQIGQRNLDAQPWWPGVRDFLVVLRPAWWVIRAWVVVQMFFIITGTGGGTLRGGLGGLLFLLAAIVFSIQLARQTPLAAGWQRGTIAIWNLLAVLLLLPVLASQPSTQDQSQPMQYTDGSISEPPSGLQLGGEQVTNVFPYDSAGRPLTGVQLYDQNGRALVISDGDTTYDEGIGGPSQLVPGSPAGSAPNWNSFPLQQRRVNAETGELGPVEPVPLPLSGVPVLPAQPTVNPTSSAEPAPTSSPTSTSTSAPAEPTKAATPKPTATK